MSSLWRGRVECQSTLTTSPKGETLKVNFFSQNQCIKTFTFVSISAIQCVGPLSELAQDETVQSIGEAMGGKEKFLIFYLFRFWTDGNAVRAV